MRATDFIEEAINRYGRILTAVKASTIDEPLQDYETDVFCGTILPYKIRFVRPATKQDWHRQMELYERLVRTPTQEQKRADIRRWEIWEVERV